MTLSSTPGADGEDLQQVKSPDHQQIDMEILSGEFDQDNSPIIDKAAPHQIRTNEEKYTTVTRETASTLYNPEGRVEATIPQAFLLNRDSSKFQPTVIEDASGKYIMLPSALKTFPTIKWNNQNGVFYISVMGYPALFTTETIAALIEFNFLQDNRRSPQYIIRANSNHQKDWESLIQQGKIRFADEEKADRLAFPQLSYVGRCNRGIETMLKAADFKSDFPQSKVTLFHHEGKINLFNWSDDIASSWSVNKIEMPAEIEKVTAAGIDPKDNFLLVAQGATLYVLDHHSQPIKIVHKLENPDSEFAGTISLRADGSILAGDRNGRLTGIISNLQSFISRKDKLEQQRTLQRLRAKKRTAQINGGKAEATTVLPEMKEISDEIATQFADDIINATTLDEVSKLKAEINTLRGEYTGEIKDSKVIDSIFKPIIDSLVAKETEILSTQIDGEMTSVRALITRIGSMSLADLADAKQKVDRVRATVMGSSLDATTKAEITQISDVFADKAAEVLGQDEDRLLIQLDTILQNAIQELDGIQKLSAFEVWQSTDYPAFLDALAAQMRIIPASHLQVIEKIRKMEETLRDRKKKASEKFKEKYEEVRQSAANRIDVVIQLATDRITEFLESFETEVHRKSFSTTEAAKQWVERSPLYSSVLSLIDDLATQDPEKAAELRQELKVQVAQYSYEVKRSKDLSVDNSTGRQMAIFGQVTFPIWEHKVVVEGEHKQSVKIELTYKVDDSSKGPGIKPEDYMCELFYRVTDENGKVQETPLHSNDTLKYGRYDERFNDYAYFASNIRLGDARKMISSVKAIESKRANDVTKKYEEFQENMKDLNKRISELKTQQNGDWSELKEERETITKEYITFLNESGIYGWYALKAFKRRYKNGENVESKDGQGRIPDWKSYWIEDLATQKSLGEFAEMSKMQLELKEGMISLEGHAGTGKDVLVQMFANKAKRPLYSFDCTKWTTEFDLSQDVSLASEEGASFTVKEDSVIVKALETPGAILYFNEFNAMPEQAQIFLHSLFDAKRQVTLKTSSGRIVKADPTVIICSSMNPGYPGTNHPQFATRSRMIPLKLAFPGFEKEDHTYDSSEALRIARSVKSLQELTYNPDMDENEFAKLWDNYINKGVSNGNMTPERKFDLEVIFALITFANQLREGFINKISKKAGRKTFTISQPFTLREMRRCAYVLSHMDPKEKQNPDNAEKMAKDLVRKFFSQYIFDEKEAEELETNLSQWTVQKVMRSATP